MITNSKSPNSTIRSAKRALPRQGKPTTKPTPLTPTLRGAYEEIPLTLIDANPDNPREDWDHQEIEKLVPSIHESGIIQAIVVRKAGTRYQLVAGERRFRAAQAARLKSIPAIVKKLSDTEALTQMCIENLLRKNLNGIEKARAIEKLCKPAEQGGAAKTQAAAAKLFGKSRSWVANLIGLLKLPEAWQRKIARGQLSERCGLMLTVHADRPEILAAVESDMEANPSLWGTTRLFERSLAIIVANPDAANEVPSNGDKPTAPRAIAVARESSPGAKEPISSSAVGGASIASGRDSGPRFDVAAARGVEAICDGIRTIQTMAELDEIQSSLDSQRASLSKSKRRSTRKAK